MKPSSKQKLLALALATLLTAGSAVSAAAAPNFSVSDPFSVPNSLITAGGRANTGYINARNQSAQQEAQQQQQAAQEAARQQSASQQPAQQVIEKVQTVDPDPDPDPELTEEEETTEPQQTAPVATTEDDTTPEKGVLKVTPVNDGIDYEEDKLNCEVYIINGFDRPVEITGKQNFTLYAGDTKVASATKNIKKPIVIQPGQYKTYKFTFNPGEFTPGITLKDLDTVARLSYAWADE